MDKYSQPIPLIAFFDTGASLSIMKKDFLLDEYWTPYVHKFRGANGKPFYAEFITKIPISLKLLPDCYVSSQFLGATFVTKGLLLGFDVYREDKYLVTGKEIK